MPYWLADANDGLGAKHYTMGGRTKVGVERYFASMADSWRAIRRLLSPGAIVVQLLAFAKPEEQLPLYLATMAAAGYSAQLDVDDVSRAWRVVPNRKWYYRTRPDREAAREVLLIHSVAY
jgi:hypothetical protein